MKNSFKKSAVGVSQQIVKEISRKKNEPAWMLELRLNALKVFNSKPMPRFGPDLRALDLNKIEYFISPKTGPSHKWEDVPADIKKTFEDLGIPQAERKYLAGAGAQLESSNIYHKLKEKWAAQGVIFEDMDAALRLYPDLVRKYFMKCISIHDHKFAALHAAVWSGGTFAYIPENVKIDQPLQAYFRMNTASAGQFEHTLIIAGKNSQSGYIEGCSAPKYNTPSLHAGCVEIFVEEGARLRYSSVENWSTNTYNLNTKRAIVGKNATMEWI
ncbi:MAG: Fe-S cluster assembly protein SufB, partial [Candidatus Gracilibacteria bacterium]